MFKIIRNAVLVIAAGMSLTACGVHTVEPGNFGIVVKPDGVQEAVLPSGIQFVGPFTRIVDYPGITRTYQWSRPTEQGLPNEEIQFTDKTGLPLSGDVSVTMRVDPTKMSAMYKKYRLSFDELRDGPVRAYARTAISDIGAGYASDQLYTTARQEVIQKALVKVQAQFAKDGIEITDMQWTGGIRFPQSVQDAIKRKTEVEQETLIAEANVQKAEMNAKALVAQAQGEADAKRILGEALRANPEVLRAQWIERWDGKLPQTMAGDDTSLLLQR